MRTLLSAKIEIQEKAGPASAFSFGQLCFWQLRRQFDQFCIHVFLFDRQPSDGHGRTEAARAGASRVEIEDAVLLFYFRMMAVAMDHNAESGGLGLEVKLGEVVQHVDQYAVRLDDFGKWQSACPWRGINVAADCRHRRDLREGFEDFNFPDVAGVENAV